MKATNPNPKASYNTFRILFLIKRGKVKKKGLVSLLIRISMNGQQVELNTRIEIDPSKWNTQSSKVDGRSSQVLETNQSIDRLRSFVNERFKYYMNRDGSVTPEKLRDAILGIEEDSYTLIKLFDKKINQQTQLVGTGITKETLQKYKATKKLIIDYLQWQYKKTDLPIREVQYDFISNYDIYLQSQCKHQHNTKVRHLRYLKQIVTDAYMCKYIQTDPFYNFKLTTKETNKEILTERDLELIMNKKFKVKRLEEVRDCFVFRITN